MRDFAKRQALLVVAAVVALLFAFASSQILGGFLLPLVYPAPLYLNPIYTFAFLFYGAIALFTVFRADDHAWPWFVGMLGLWILLVTFEDNILQWFVFQLGLGTSGGRISLLGITASLAAMAAAILLHVNQLARRLRVGFAERGLDPRELQQVEAQSRRLGLHTVGRVFLLTVGALVVLRLAERALGGQRVGIGALGILGGLLIVALLAVMSYRLLRQGPGAPAVGPAEEAEQTTVKGPRRRPPRGLR